MYTAALDYVSLVKVNDQSQVHLFIIHQSYFIPPQQTVRSASKETEL